MRVTSTMTARRILADIAAANARLTKAQEKLASGKELNRPSDDPSAVGRAIQLRREMEATQQYQTNTGEATGWTDVTDSALGSIADALARVRDLTVQGANDAAGSDNRTAIIEELKQLLDTVKSAGNATYDGRYVFSGSKTDTRPYQMGADDSFSGNGDPILREIGPGVNVQINVAGNAFLGDATSGLIGTLRTVLGHMTSGTGDQLSADLKTLDTRLDELNAVRATIGATQNRVETADARLQEYEGTTLELLNNTEGADIAKTMIDFSTQQAAMTAGLKAGASIVQNSLLDFLR